MSVALLFTILTNVFMTLVLLSKRGYLQKCRKLTTGHNSPTDMYCKLVHLYHNILPRNTKLEDSIHKFDQKLTTEQDTIQINALDFDPDIDGPNIPRTYNNTAVVSVKEWLTSPEPEFSRCCKFPRRNY